MSVIVHEFKGAFLLLKTKNIKHTIIEVLPGHQQPRVMGSPYDVPSLLIAGLIESGN